MTCLTVSAPDRFALPTPDAGARPALRLSSSSGDRIARLVLPALLLTSVWLSWMLAAGADAGATARDACVMAALQDARAFTAVLGDDRPVTLSFAEQWCARR